MSALATFGSTGLAAFMASTVECVEALTVVMAVGVVRGWRSALIGTGVGLLVLLALVAVFGSSLSAVPLPVLRSVVGTLLLLFGLRWLRKAILRAAGVIPLHDEVAAFAKEASGLRDMSSASARGIDMPAFLTSFKAVVLEGIEVVFIVIAVAANGTLLPAAIGAGVALLLVVALGLALRRPLSAIPENSLKFAVGVLLTGFGCFWVGEGLGLAWAAGDSSILGLALGFATLALALVVGARRLHASHLRHRDAEDTPSKGVAIQRRGAVAATARQAWGLFVDDGWLAAGVLAVVAAVHVSTRIAGVAWPGTNTLMVLCLAVVLSASALRRAVR